MYAKMSGKSEVRLFDHNLPQIAIVSSYFYDVNPTTAIGEAKSEIEFYINGSGSEYLDLNDSLLTITLFMYDQNGERIEAGNNLGGIRPVNHFMNSIFSDIKLQLNDTIIEGGNDYYPWKATIEDVFNFDEATKEIQLRPKGYQRSEEDRKTWFAKGTKALELSGALRLNFFTQSKYLIPGVDVRITLKRTESSFSFMGGLTGAERAKLVVIAAKLRVRKALCNPSVEYGHNLGLETSNVIYQYNVAKIVKHQINVGTWTYVKDNIFSSPILPKFVIIGLITQTAYSGSNTKESPFDFKPFDLKKIALFVDGSSVPFRSGYEPNFQTPLLSDVYMRSIVQGGTHFNRNLNNGITMEDFQNGPYTFYTFNLTPDYNYYQTQFPKSAPVRLDITFGTALLTPINVIVYAIYDSQLEITKDRQINCANHVL